MKKLLSLKIINKRILCLLEKCDIIGLIFCLFSFLVTYYYFESFKPEVLNIGILLFQTGLSIKIGGIISSLIIQNNL